MFSEVKEQLKSLGDIKEELKQLSSIKRDTRELTDIKTDIGCLRSELRNYQSESLDKFSSMVKLLKEIVDKPMVVTPSPPAASRASGGYAGAAESSLTEEEKLLLESFGISPTGQPAVNPAVSAYNPLLVQQQLMMLAAASQPRPVLPPTGLYPQPLGSFVAPGKKKHFFFKRKCLPEIFYY